MYYYLVEFYTFIVLQCLCSLKKPELEILANVLRT